MGKLVNDIISPFTGADRVRGAADAAAEQQRQAGLTSANIAAFRPVGMTTRFGTSNFVRKVDPKTGVAYIASAGYTAAPELSALQNQLFGQFGSSLNQAQAQAAQYAPLSGASRSLFDLGQQYLATSPEQAAQDYMASQQALLAPSRAAQLADVQNKAYQTGRAGLGVQTGTGTGLTSPEMQALANARAQQDLQLAAQAEQQGRQRTQYGASLFGTGAGLLGTQASGQAGVYSPLLAQLGLTQNIESMAQQPYQLGLQLGQAQQPGQTAGAQGMLTGALQGAATQYQGQLQAQQMNNQFLSSLIGSAAAGMGGGGGAGGSVASPLFGGNAGSGWGGFQNWLVRGQNQASPDFVGPGFN